MYAPHAEFNYVNFNTFYDQSTEETQRIQILAFKYLGLLFSSQNILTDQKALDALKFTYINSIGFKAIQFSNLSIDYNFSQIVINLLETLNVRMKHSFEQERFYSTSNTWTDNDLTITVYISSVLSSYTLYSYRFCSYFSEEYGLPILFKFINSHEIVQKYLSSYQLSNKRVFSLIDSFLRSVLNSMFNISRKLGGELRQIWNNCLAVESLLKFERTANIFENKIGIYLVILNIASLKQIEDTFNSSPDYVLLTLTDLIVQCVSMVVTKINLNRVRVFEENEINGFREACTVKISQITWSLVDLLNGIHNLAISDFLKKKIYYEYKMSDHLKSIILFGNNVEKEYALKLLWQLTFHTDIVKNVYEDLELRKSIEDLSILDYTPESKEILEQSNGILQNIKIKFLSLTKNSAQHSSEKSNFNSNQVFFSYHSRSKETCVLIRNELEKVGVRVFMHLENEKANDFGLILNAIQDSMVVLICLSEDYKKSPKCRVETEFALKSNKSIIPLILQKSFSFDGW